MTRFDDAGRPTAVNATVNEAETHGLAQAKRGRAVRRIALAVILAFVLLGLFGVFGYREGHERATGAGYQVDLSHPAVTRGGLPAAWALTVRTVDGSPLAGTVVVTTTSSYFTSFDHNTLDPPPDRTWQDDENLRWEFDADGDTDALTVTIDLRTQPDARWEHDVTTTIDVDGHHVASIDYQTWILP